MHDVNRRNTAPTIHDVARRAGVSTATVSRALNKHGSITKELYIRVMAAIEELGYRPQRKRAKVKSPSAWLYVLNETLNEPFFLEVIAGIQEQAEEDNLLAAILSVSSKRSRLLKTLETLKSQHSFGIAVAGVYMKPEEWILYQQALGVPIVLMNTHVDHRHIASIMVDFEKGAYQAVEYLLSLNHSQIAYFGNYENEFAAAQLQGMKRALKTHGIDYPDQYRFSISHTEEGASQGVSKLVMLDKSQRPTAIFAFDDLLAIHLLNALRHHRLNVPNDISVIGFDNIPMSAHSNPPLTTVDIPKRRIGRLMVKLIRQLLANDESSGAVNIEGSLIVRGSTAPVRLDRIK